MGFPQHTKREFSGNIEKKRKKIGRGTQEILGTYTLFPEGKWKSFREKRGGEIIRFNQLEKVYCSGRGTKRKPRENSKAETYSEGPSLGGKCRNRRGSKIKWGVIGEKNLDAGGLTGKADQGKYRPRLKGGED